MDMRALLVLVASLPPFNTSPFADAMAKDAIYNLKKMFKTTKPLNFTHKLNNTKNQKVTIQNISDLVKDFLYSRHLYIFIS